MLTQLQFAVNITGPILLLLSIGWFVRRRQWIDDQFINQANRVVFNIAMPAMLFFALASQSFDQAINPLLTIVGLVGTLLLILLLLIVGKVLPEDMRGVFVQGSYRGNLAILGVALAVATYGEHILPMVALYLAVVTTAYNIVAVWLLAPSSGVLLKILRNPILLGILAGSIASLLPIELPVILRSTGQYLADMTLPVALICIGAGLHFGSLRHNSLYLTMAVFFKLIVSPALLLSLGIWGGLDPEALGVLFFMAASPTATASYIMARQMTAYGNLAGEIVAVTTAMGVLSYTLGLALLKQWQLI